MPRINGILEARRQRIESSLSRADELKAHAERVRQEFEAFLATTRSKAHEDVMQMIHKVTVTSSQKKKDMNALVVSRIQSAEERITKQKLLAMDGIKVVAENTAIEMVEKLLQQKIDAKSAGDIVNKLFSQKVA